MTIDEIKSIILGAKSKRDASYKLYGYNNKYSSKRIDEYLLQFNHGYQKQKELKYCKFCGAEIIVSPNVFCNSSCAASMNNANRKHSLETKEKISISLKGKFRGKYVGERVYKNKICLQCGEVYSSKERRKSQFCSDECRKIHSNYLLTISGRKAARSQNRRSKNEMLFASLCENEYNNVLCNEAMFNGWDADVILKDYKLAILWNGAWHYKEISKKCSLKQIQNRDKIKLNEIEKNGYTSYVIQDLGKYNEEFVYEKFEELKNYIYKI